MRNIWIIAVVVLLVGCGVNKAKIAKEAEGPRDLYVSLANDPLLISIELKLELEARGYNVALSSEEYQQSVVVDHGDGKTIYHNANSAPHRYELSLGYQPIQDRIQTISALVRDRESGDVMATYRWTWNHMLPAPTIEGAIDMIDKNLLTPVFRE